MQGFIVSSASPNGQAPYLRQGESCLNDIGIRCLTAAPSSCTFPFDLVLGTGMLGRPGLQFRQSRPKFGRPRLLMSVTPPSYSRNANKLRDILARPEILLMPCCFDPLSAKLVERAGFPLTFMSGFSTAASKGFPDTGLLSYGEMRDQIADICSVITFPLIADGDTGYGNAINIKRTIHGYSAAGAAGILIEDQVNPKRCGHTKGKAVVSREEAFSRLQAAIDARDEGSNIVIVARTDACACISFDEAVYRAQKFHDMGADVTFLEAPRSIDEMTRYCNLVPGPKLANCLEGGETPILSPDVLQDIGYKIAAYPLSLLSSAVLAMETTLAALKSGNPENVSPLIKTFPALREVVGFDEYYKEEDRYKL